MAALREKVDGACRAAGRDPAAVERTVAVLVRFAGGTGRHPGDDDAEVLPVTGPPEAIADMLRGFAKEGIGQVQLVLDPIN